MRTAIGIARPSGAVGRVGVPQVESIPASLPAYFANVTVGGGLAPVHAYVEELLPDVLEGRIEPGRVFDRVAGLDEVPHGYRAMNDREAIKIGAAMTPMVTFSPRRIRVARYRGCARSRARSATPRT